MGKNENSKRVYEGRKPPELNEEALEELLLNREVWFLVKSAAASRERPATFNIRVVSEGNIAKKLDLMSE